MVGCGLVVHDMVVAERLEPGQRHLANALADRLHYAIACCGVVCRVHVLVAAFCETPFEALRTPVAKFTGTETVGLVER